MLGVAFLGIQKEIPKNDHSKKWCRQPPELLLLKHGRMAEERFAGSAWVGPALERTQLSSCHFQSSKLHKIPKPCATFQTRRRSRVWLRSSRPIQSYSNDLPSWMSNVENCWENGSRTNAPRHCEDGLFIRTIQPSKSWEPLAVWSYHWWTVLRQNFIPLYFFSGKMLFGQRIEEKLNT